MNSPLHPRKILVDTDPGGDDIFALLWLQSLAKQGLAEIVAITTVDGNVRAKYTFNAASKILSVCGFPEVEIGRGVPFHEQEVEDAAYIHGADGMGNLSPTLPEPIQQFETARYADEILIERLNENPGEITLVTLAPLTNLAAAERKQPGILKQAKEIVMMAGAFNCPGNVTPHAEFNIAYNPEAASVVFNSRQDLIVLSMDVTSQLIFTELMALDVYQTQPENSIAKFIFSLTQFMKKTAMAYKETQGQKGFVVHDAVTLAYLFYPETLLLRRAQVSVETQGQYTRGKTLLDNRHLPKTQPNAFVALQVDAVNLLAVLAEDLKRLLS
ncbi:MAG: nucleoside hydrolase [Desertifilum sp. SIO1I2]|nr:nucleoside hydrolase [Desertifilum sp. SIO1I2]